MQRKKELHPRRHPTPLLPTPPHPTPTHPTHPTPHPTHPSLAPTMVGSVAILAQAAVAVAVAKGNQLSILISIVDIDVVWFVDIDFNCRY